MLASLHTLKGPMKCDNQAWSCMWPQSLSTHAAVLSTSGHLQTFISVSTATAAISAAATLILLLLPFKDTSQDCGIM